MTDWLQAPAAGATRMILVRHGEPDASVRGRCYGRLDVGLSSRGREQMRDTWRLLRDRPLVAVYSSPMRRALESVAEAAGVPRAAVDDRLREIDFGELEGFTYDEIATRYPGAYRQWMTRPAEIAFPGGESLTAMILRVTCAMDDIRRRHPGGTVVVVSHGGVNRIVIARALALPTRRLFRLDQGYACVNVIDYTAGEPTVRLVNGLAHLQC